MTKFTAAEANAFLDAAFKGRGRQNEVILMEEGRAILRLQADETDNSEAHELAEPVWCLGRNEHAKHRDQNEGEDDHQAPDQPQLLPHHREDKVGMGVGHVHQFLAPLAQPEPE